MRTTAARRVARRRALSFSLRGLMLSFVVVSLPLALLVQRAQRQKNAVRILREAGVQAYYDFQLGDPDNPDEDAEPPGPDWLRSTLGIDYVARVHGVDCQSVRSPANWPDILMRIGNLPDLRRVSLSRCDADPEDYLPLRALEDLEWFGAADSTIGDASLIILSGMPNLKTLRLDYSLVEGKGLAHLHASRSLQTISLKGCPLHDETTAIPPGLPALKQLDLTATPIHGRALAPLADCPLLATLDLSGCPIDERALPYLSRLVALRDLNLSRTPVGDELIQQLAALRNLQRLNLSCTRISDAGLAVFSHLPELEALDLSGAFVAGPGLGHFRNAPGRIALNLDSTLIDDKGLASLVGAHSIFDLSVLWNDITPLGVVHVARLPRLSSLKFFTGGGFLPGIRAADPKVRELLNLAQSSLATSQTRREFAEQANSLAEELERESAIGDERMRERADEWNRLESRLASSSAEVHRAVPYGPPPYSTFSRYWLLVGREPDPGGLLGLDPPVFGSLREEDRLRRLQCAAIRRQYGLTPVFPEPEFPPPLAISREDRRKLFDGFRRGLPHEPLLSELIDWPDEATALAALEVAAKPDATAWRSLLDAAPASLAPRLLAAWRESEPNNGAAWFCARHGYQKYARVWGDRELLESIRRGNRCSQVVFHPRPPWLSAEVQADVEAIFEDEFSDEDFPLRFWSNPWHWHGAWNWADALVYDLAERETTLVEDGFLEEGLEYRRAAEGLATRFIVASPRELGTVLQGCRMLIDWMGAEYRRSGRFSTVDEVTNGLRRTACFRLAQSLVHLSTDPELGPPIDEAAMTAWMSGLERCGDPRALEMNRAIDAWEALEARIAPADMRQLQSVYEELWHEPLPLDDAGWAQLWNLREEPDFTELDPSSNDLGDESPHIMRPGPTPERFDPQGGGLF